MIQIDHYVYANKMLNIHPAEKFALCVLAMLTCLAANSVAVSLAVLAVMMVLVVGRARIPVGFFLRILLIPLAFLLVGVLTILFSLVKDPTGLLYYVSIGGYVLGVTARDMQTALLLVTKSFGAVSCLYFLALTTPMVEIISVLRKLRLPALFVELMSLIYRFIFILLETAASIHTAQSARLGHVNWRSTWRSTSQLLYSLFVRSFVRSQALATALEARCYHGEMRVLEKIYPVSPKNYALIALVEILLIVIYFIFAGGNLLG